MANETIRFSADNSAAKMSINEITDLISDAQKKIDRVFNSARNNNNTISNKSLAGVQNLNGFMNEAQNQLKQQLDQANLSGNKDLQSQAERVIAPLLQQVQSMQSSLNSLNAGKLSTINNARTTSSRVFRSSEYDQQNLEDKIDLRELRSTVRNLASNINRTSDNFNSATATGTISYNRMQGYQGSVSASNSRANQIRKRIDDLRNGYTDHNGTHHAGLTERRDQLASDYRDYQAKASSATATTDDVRKARATDEEIKQLDKSIAQLNEFNATLEKANKNNESLKSQVDSVANGDTDVKVGRDPNSVLGQLSKRKYSIYRGALAAGLANTSGMISQGSNLRLQAFDDIKSIGYANGDKDNHVLNSLGDAGYRYGYSGADMAGFANAYTSSTGNVGSTRQVTDTAQEWARQSRITGGNAETTQALEQAAGDAVNLTAGQMKSLGNGITNEITSSGMSGKGAEQQQGLAMMYQNATPYGATNSDLRNMAGLQGSLAKYGSAFQGTQGAQTITQLTQGLGNYNNPAMRQLMGQGDPRYTGQNGNARLMEDMQNMQKNPASMSRVLTATEKSFGGNKLQAAAFLSQNTGVPIDTLMKVMKANDRGDLSKKSLNKYLKNSKQANKNEQSYQKSGAATVQKYNAALANSAIKASQALDLFRKGLAKALQKSGPFGGLMMGVGSGLTQGLIDIFASGGFKGTGELAKAGLDWLKKGKTGKVLEGASKWLHSGKTGRILERSGNWLKSGKTGRLLEYGRGLFKSGRHAAPHGLGSIFRSSKNVAQGAREAERLRGVARGVRALKGRTGIGGDIALGGIDALLTYASTKKGSRSRYTSMGDSLGSTTGGLAGVAAGAAIGSVVPGLGTAIGGLVGGIAGTFLGGKGGKAIGKGLYNLKHHKVTSGGLLGGMLGGAILPGAGMLVGGLIGNGHGKNIAKGLSGHLKNLFKPTVAHAAVRKGTEKNSNKKSKSSNSDDWKLLRGYNKMLDHALRVVQEAKSIKAGGDDNDSDKDSKDIGDTSDLDKAAKEVAKKVGKKLGIDPKMIYGQEWAEMGAHMSGAPAYAAKYHNLSGIKWAGQKGAKEGSGGSDDGGNYADFDSWDSFADNYAKTLSGYADQLKAAGHNYEKYAEILHANKYFSSGNVSGYAASLKAGAEAYAVGGLAPRMFASGTGMIASQPMQGGNGDIFAEAGTEAYVPLNNSHYSSGLSALGDLAGLFGKKVIDAGQLSSQRNTTINPSYNINLTIQGGTDNAQSLAQTVAERVQAMLRSFDQQQAINNKQMYYNNETSGQFV